MSGAAVKEVKQSQIKELKKKIMHNGKSGLGGGKEALPPCSPQSFREKA